LLFDADLLANSHLIRRDIDLLAVHENMSMPDELSGLCMRCGEAETDQNVVQPAFKLRQQVFARYAFLPDCLFEIGSKLILEYAVNTLHLLLLAQLKSVSDDFRLPVVAVLTWGEVSFLDSAR